MSDSLGAARASAAFSIEPLGSSEKGEFISRKENTQGEAFSLSQNSRALFILRLGKQLTFVIQPAESPWLHLPLIARLKKDCGEVFPVAEYAYTTIPTYPSGQIGFMVCCKDATRDVKVPLRSWTKEEEDEKLRYYNSEIHKASFVLPNFAKKALQ